LDMKQVKDELSITYSSYRIQDAENQLTIYTNKREDEFYKLYGNWIKENE